MGHDNMDKQIQKKEILMKDEKTDVYYEDHITQIVRRAEKEGAFDHVKGKPLEFDDDSLAYNPEKRLHKVMKDNNILPKWIQLSKEIDQLKEELTWYTNEYNIRNTIEKINKKVFEHNFSCPPTAQKRKLKVEDYINPKSE
jgi:hypothetical protein